RLHRRVRPAAALVRQGRVDGPHGARPLVPERLEHLALRLADRGLACVHGLPPTTCRWTLLQTVGARQAEIAVQTACLAGRDRLMLWCDCYLGGALPKGVVGGAAAGPSGGRVAAGVWAASDSSPPGNESRETNLSALTARGDSD